MFAFIHRADKIVALAVLALTALATLPAAAQTPGDKQSVEISEDGTPVAPPVAEKAPDQPTTASATLAPETEVQATTGTVRMLKTLEAFHKNIKSVHAAFDQLRIDTTFEDKIASKGELWFTKPDHFRCDYADPQPMINLIVGLNFWMYMPELEQADHYVFDNATDRDQQLHQILMAFGFKTDQLLKEYEIHSSVDEDQPREMLVKEKMDPEKFLLFTVKPRPAYAETAPFLESRIYIDRATLLPVKIWYSDQNDSTMDLTMKKIDLDAKIDDKVYDVKEVIPTGTDIIDKRNMQ